MNHAVLLQTGVCVQVEGGWLPGVGQKQAEEPMTIRISPEAEEILQKRALAEGVSVEAYVGQLVREDEERGELSEARMTPHGPDFAELRTAVMEGLEQARRGESRPAEVVFAALRAKHGLLR